MEISTVIRNLKDYCRGVWNNKVIDEQTTRDQILYGDPRQTCTGIVTTCWAYCRRHQTGSHAGRQSDHRT